MNASIEIQRGLSNSDLPYTGESAAIGLFGWRIKVHSFCEAEKCCINQWRASVDEARVKNVNADLVTYTAVSRPDGSRLLEPLASPHSSWSGLPMELQLLPGNAEIRDIQLVVPSLAVARSGRGKRRYVSTGRDRDLYSAPSMFELYSADFHIDHGIWQGASGEIVTIQFPGLLVDRLLHAEGRGFQLKTMHEQFNARVTELVSALWSEAAAGGPRGKLYSQGLSIALLGLLVEEYGACPGADTKSRARLTPAECAALRDYVEQHLDCDVSVDALAALMNMSAAHFSRAFKASFEVSPHAYVTERRIERAKLLLRSKGQHTLADVAALLGFSSQSHFTEAFRRKVGATPARWRSST